MFLQGLGEPNSVLEILLDSGQIAQPLSLRYIDFCKRVVSNGRMLRLGTSLSEGWSPPRTLANPRNQLENYTRYFQQPENLKLTEILLRRHHFSVHEIGGV
jgi:hypothetical protein